MRLFSKDSPFYFGHVGNKTLNLNEEKITLNLKLIQHPKRLIDYIIVHELVHLVEHNHGPASYQLLTKNMPDWENRRTALNEDEE